VLAARHLGDNIGRIIVRLAALVVLSSVDRLVSTDELDAAVADPSLGPTAPVAPLLPT
jgi:hypothetical protein